MEASVWITRLGRHIRTTLVPARTSVACEGGRNGWLVILAIDTGLGWEVRLLLFAYGSQGLCYACSLYPLLRAADRLLAFKMFSSESR